MASPPASSRHRRALFAALTSAVLLLLIELGSAAAERTVLLPAMPTPSPSAPWLDVSQAAAIRPEQAARWGARSGRAQAPLPQGAHFALQEDATKGWRLPVGQRGVSRGVEYRINRLGMRGPSLGTRQPGEVRLLSLGDSSIYGDTVAEEDVFTAIAAPQLAASWGCTVTAVNGGVPGYTSAQALIWLREVWDAVQPGVVVVGTMWSDIYPGDGRPQVHRNLREPLRRLATYRVLRMLLAPWLSPQKVRWIRGRADLVADDAEAAVPLGAYIDNLQQIAAVVRERGGAVAFLALPAPVDLDTAPVPELIQEYRAAMALVAQETGSALIDGPAWLAREGGGLALFNDNVHPSAEGHALIGYATAQVLSAVSVPCP